MPKFDDLKFVRITQPDIITHVPIKLFEQIEGVDADMIERIKVFGPRSVANPFTLLYTLVDDRHIIHGVLWASIDLIAGVVWIKMFSVDKEYRGGGIKKATDFLLKQMEGSKITRIECLQRNPAIAKKAGWTKSEQTHLIYEVNQNEATEPVKKD